MRIYTPSSNYITITRKEMGIANNSCNRFYPTIDMMYHCIFLFNDDMAKGYLELSEEISRLITEGKTNKAAVEEVKAAGAVACESSVATVEGVDAVITMLPNSPHVKSVMLENDKVAEHMPKTATFIDCSSISPIASREIAEELSKLGIDMLDAPVSGGQPKAVDGTLAFMVGGKQETFDKFKDVLAAMGSSVVLCGNVGAGNVTKLCNQTIVAVNIAVLAEALQMGQMCGVEPQKIFEAIKGGLAGSTVMNAKAPMMMDQNFQPGFRIDLHIKDLNNVVDAAKAVDAPIPLTQSVLEMMKILHKDGDGVCDHSALLKYYQKLTGEVLHH